MGSTPSPHVGIMAWTQGPTQAHEWRDPNMCGIFSHNEESSKRRV